MEKRESLGHIEISWLRRKTRLALVVGAARCSRHSTLKGCMYVTQDQTERRVIAPAFALTGCHARQHFHYPPLGKPDAGTSSNSAYKINWVPSSFASAADIAA